MRQRIIPKFYVVSVINVTLRLRVASPLLMAWIPSFVRMTSIYESLRSL